jgi:hypothetical protein
MIEQKRTFNVLDMLLYQNIENFTHSQHPVYHIIFAKISHGLNIYIYKEKIIVYASFSYFVEMGMQVNLNQHIYVTS